MVAQANKTGTSKNTTNEKEKKHCFDLICIAYCCLPCLLGE